MRGLILGVGALVVLLIAAALSYALRIGPLAPLTAARSTVFVAISRGLDPADAREIESIDLAGGARELFDVGDGPITALALSRDRRSLYVGLVSGKVLMLDATTGARFGAVALGGTPITSLVATADGSTLFAYSATNAESSVVPIILASKTTADAIRLPPTAGPPVIQGDDLVIAFKDQGGLELTYLDVATRAERSRLTIPSQGLGALAAFPIGGTLVGVAAFDQASPGTMTLHLFVVADRSSWRDVVVPGPDPRGQFGFRPSATSAGDAIHLCGIQDKQASRYVFAIADLAPTPVDGSCGPLVTGERLVMAMREGSQLLLLEPKTGKAIGAFPLAGVPTAVAH
jgi:hypothetical protein